MKATIQISDVWGNKLHFSEKKKVTNFESIIWMSRETHTPEMQRQNKEEKLGL